ncbi:MAG: Dihydrofolate reductase [Panacagrimonas sp.]|nr:dihydrofolate reductase [Panacagrimonas sp.]MCC2658987.1 Dihydrofolate reductase [Panacagrimonas sp.]
MSLIVAMDRSGLIGRGLDLPWHLPADLAHFKRTTMGKTILMGRRTWQSIGRPLPGRENWVVTRDPAFRAEGARVFDSVEAAIAAHPRGELMVIGGADLYRQTLPLARRIYLTEVLADVGPPTADDVRLEAFDRGAFREVWSEDHAADDRHAHAFRFIMLERL